MLSYEINSTYSRPEIQNNIPMLKLTYLSGTKTWSKRSSNISMMYVFNLTHTHKPLTCGIYEMTEYHQDPDPALFVVAL